ncbi:DUF423 domain-containing protein [Flavobacteriaceae bacterium Ap0902]|nr:DUF423 domain-containing protein [Flavobacteriaceae bacterium Ap0902]
MKQITLIFAAAYGMLSIILGAFGAHAFKKLISVEKLASFEIGVRYMMYHAIVLLALGLFLNFETSLEKNVTRLMIIGTFFFSVSIYFLAFSERMAIPTKILGPITPIGGLLMILGWAFLLFYFIKYFKV